MDEITNPYAPGAGVRPHALAGRDQQMSTWRIAMARVAQGRHARSMILYGLRGVGKTVLLSEFARIARSKGWITAKIEADPRVPLRGALSDALHDDLVDLATPGVGKRVLKALKTAMSFKAAVSADGTWSFGLDLSDAPGGGADTGDVDVDVRKLLRDLAGAAEAQDVGLCILIDEAQDLGSDELSAICSGVHRANQDGDRLLVAMAGLPRLPEKLAAAESYAERLFDFHEIDSLDESAARDAIERPSQHEGVDWHDDALRALLTESRGYPYFVQQFAYDTWNSAPGSPIGLADARLGIANGLRALDRGFFRSRWDRATRGERAYLRAIAQHGDSCESRNVADTMSRSVQSLGPTRQKLIDKGLIYAPNHGWVAFTVPGMASFISRELE